LSDTLLTSISFAFEQAYVAEVWVAASKVSFTVSSTAPASGRPLTRQWSRHSPDDSRTGVNIRAFPVSLEDRREVRTPTGTFGQPERLVEGLIWPSPWHLDALLLSVALERMTVERLMLALVVAAAAVPR
jgi:hypothetical protein